MIQLNPTPATLAIGIAVLLFVGAFSFVLWRRSPHPRRTAALEVLRFLCVALIVVLLWQPEWKTTVNPDTKPKIVILWDDSGSMASIDAELPRELGGDGSVVSRREFVERALASDLWLPLDESGANDVRTRAFDTADEDSPQAMLAGTDISGALTSLLEEENNLRAVVMLSDGDATLGQPPVAAAQQMRLRGVPLFTVPVGSESRLPDLDLLSVSAPTYGIVGENVQIPFTIRSSLDRQVSTVVRLRDEASGIERTKDILLPPQSETHDSILWRLEQEGSGTLTLSVPVADGELIEENNTRSFNISGRPERIRVLVIDTLPRWEYRFLRNALSRDPGVVLSSLLLHPELGPGDGPDYIQEFPEEPEELAAYDVIFVGDIGIGPDQLTLEQANLISGLVENQASGVVFLPGQQGNQLTLLDSELGDLIPVRLDGNAPTGMPELLAAPLNLTSEGRSSLLTMLGDSEEENPEIWRRLPGFHWHAPVIRAKAGTEVLAVHGNRRGPFGQIPLIVTAAAGNGKVLFMGIDSAWRWRRGVEDLYHYRFWGQVARWMSYQRNMAAGQRVRLYYTPERPEPGANVTIHANAFDGNGAPLQDGSVRLDLTAPDGHTRRIELQANDAGWGAFSGRFRVEVPGTWQMRASVAGAEDEPVETTLLVQSVPIEKTGQPARPDVLEEMARIARGRMLQPAQLGAIVREIHALPEPRPLETRVALWSHWGTLVLVTLLLSLFWVGRKLNGMF